MVLSLVGLIYFFFLKNSESLLEILLGSILNLINHLGDGCQLIDHKWQ